MSYNANFPVSADVLANPTSLTNRDDAGFELHGVISRIQDILEALEAKLGIGASTPPATAAVLRRTATGASAWGQVATADLAALAVSQVVSTGLPAANTTATFMTFMTGAGINITTTGGPLLILVTLLGMSNDSAGLGSVELWEGGAAISSMQINDLTTARGTRAAHYIFVPSAAAHTYTLSWSTTAGTIRHLGGTFTGIELKR